MDKTLQISERAWVTAKLVTLQKPIAVGDQPTVVAELQNSGHSPAMNVTLIHWAGITDRLPDTEELPLKTSLDEQSVSVIGPGFPIISTVRLPQKLTNAGIRNLMHGTSRVYTFGKVEYTDIFNNKHTTIFCFKSHSVTDTTLALCSKWNTAN